jgi:hypothetical protein
MSIANVVAGAGIGAGLIGVVAIFVVAMMFVASLPVLLTGLAAWKRVSREFPEALDLKNLGLVSFFSMGLPLLGIWPYFAIHRNRIKSDAQLASWLELPVMLWLGSFFGSIVGGLLLGSFIGVVPLGISGLCTFAWVTLLVAGGWRSAEPLYQESARATLKAWLGSFIAGTFWVGMVAHKHSLDGTGAVVGGLLLYIVALYSTYYFVRQNLTLLLAFTRAMPERRANLSGTLSGLGFLVFAVPLAIMMVVPVALAMHH